MFNLFKLAPTTSAAPSFSAVEFGKIGSGVSLSSLFLSHDVCQGDRMLAKIYSAAIYGVDAYEVEIEVNAAGGSPVIVIVGLPDAAVKESRDRVTTAISNSGYFWPRGRTTIRML
jgi:hypothetical protein